jgi:hypothetical protein
LDELSDTLAKSKALIGEKDIYLTESERLIALKDKQLEEEIQKLLSSFECSFLNIFLLFFFF